MEFEKNQNYKIQKLETIVLIVLLLLVSAVSITAIPQENTNSKTNQNSPSTTSTQLTNYIPKDILNQLLTQSAQSGQEKMLSSSEITLPFSGFIQNEGQKADSVDYYYSAQNSAVGFGLSKIFFQQTLPELNNKTISFSVSFAGSVPTIPVGQEPSSSRTNYFIGTNQYTNIPSYQEVWYHGIYPNIDLRYYMTSQGLKYDFIVYPGGNPHSIQMVVSGNVASHLSSTAVQISTRTNPAINLLSDTNLQVYQKIGNQKTSIDASFSLHNAVSSESSYSFSIPKYDASRSLIIDPLILGFSTYLGGGGFDGSIGNGIAVDSANNSYITGYTTSTNFPTFQAYQSTFGGSSDAFVTKLNATGNGLVFSTYLGGNGTDYGIGIAIDSAGNSYITGQARSNFPTFQAYNSIFNHYSMGMAFVTKLNATGNGLVYSTYLGGSGEEFGSGIAIDSDGNSYITGYTASNDFPTFQAYQSTSGGSNDAFVTKLNATGNGLVFSTYLGGSGSDEGNGLAVDSAGNSYITGDTGSTNFPTVHAYQSTFGGSSDAFVTKLNAAGNGLVFSTYLGGNGSDKGYGIAVDSAGNSYITGDTGSTNFPTVHAYQSTFGGSYDAFVTKLNAAGNGLVFSTYLGGSGEESGSGIAVDSAGNSYITGYTFSGDFPTVHAYQSTYSGSQDAFVTKFLLDSNPPMISLNSPSDNSFDQSGTIINLTISGPISQVWYNWDGGTNVILTSPYDLSLVSPEGYHTLTVFASDSLGFIQVATFVFTTDDTGPTILLVSPTNNSINQVGTQIKLAISDPAGISTVLYKWDNDSNVNLASPYDLSLVSPEGLHTLTVFATDTAGNVQVATYVFTTDSTPPTIQLISPTNNSVQHAGTLINLAISDLNGISRVWYNWDSGAISTLTSPYGIPLVSPDGIHTLTVFTNDTAGNVQVATYVFTTDSTPPTFQLISPTNNSVQHAGTLINLAISDLNGISRVWYNWDSGSNSALISPYVIPLVSPDGIHTLTVFANDTAGNVKIETFVFTTDDTGPTIQLVNPANNTVNRAGTLINLTITDPSGVSTVQYEWDGGAFLALNSPYTIAIPTSLGQHVLFIYCSDSLNNWQNKTFVFITGIPLTSTPTSSTTSSTSSLITSTTTSSKTKASSLPNMLIFAIFLVPVSFLLRKRRKKNN